MRVTATGTTRTGSPRLSTYLQRCLCPPINFLRILFLNLQWPFLSVVQAFKRFTLRLMARYAIHGRWLLVDCWFEWKKFVRSVSPTHSTMLVASFACIFCILYWQFHVCNNRRHNATIVVVSVLL